MAQQPARARLPRWSSTWPKLWCMLLCLPQLAWSVLDENESRQLKDILDLTLGAAWGQTFNAPCDPEESSLKQWGVFITCLTVGDREHIESLSLKGERFTGSLSNLNEFNFTMMETFKVEDTSLRGSLPLSLRSESLRTLDFHFNLNMTGSLPDAWADSFPALETLVLGPSQWQGVLPKSWGLNTSFPKLTWLQIQGPAHVQQGSERLGLTGPIPSTWVRPGSFPNLVVCNEAFCHNALTVYTFGVLQTFDSVQFLDLSQNSLSGRVPLAMLAERTQADEPFPALRKARVFRQWGANMCAHLTGPQLSEIRDLPEIHSTTRIGRFPESLPNSDLSSFPSECTAGEVGLRWSQVTSDVANYGNAGPTFLPAEPPVFSWPPQARHRQSLHLTTSSGVNGCDTLDYCQWPGVICDPEEQLSVASIRVERGTMPDTIDSATRNLDRFRAQRVGFLPQISRNGSFPKLQSVEIEMGVWGPIPDSWMQPWRLQSLRNISLPGSNFIHALPEDLFESSSKIERLHVDTNERMGCLPMSLGLASDVKLQSLRIAGSDADDELYGALQLPKQLQCPVPAQVLRTPQGLEGSWPTTNREYGALATVTQLDISGTSAVLDMADFTCKLTNTCKQEDACNFSWKEFTALKGQACGRTYLPEALVDICGQRDPGVAEFGCADTALATCAADFECEGQPFSGLACSRMRLVSTLLPGPQAAAHIPSGPYSSALSAAIAAGAAELPHTSIHTVGRAAVRGYRVWSGSTPCTDLVLQNASTIAADLQSYMGNEADKASLQNDAQSIQELMPLLSSVRCDMPDLSNSHRAVQVPPWMPATHYLIQLYVVDKVAGRVQGSGDSAVSQECAQLGRRLLQQDDSCNSSCLAQKVLGMILQPEEQFQNANAAMVEALLQMQMFTGELSAVSEPNLLPEIGLNDSAGGSTSSRMLPIALGVALPIAFGLLLMIGCCLMRQRRRPTPSPRTYVAGAQGAAEPMLPEERREQLKGLLKFLRKKRSEEVTLARTRPLGEPVELGPEPATRTKVEHIVKALLCASAPGPIAAEFSYEPQAIRRSVLNTTDSSMTRKAAPTFQADEVTLLKRLVLKGSDANMPAAARLSSANDQLFTGDPFGIYRTVQFQTNLWEMLLSYREEERKVWEPALRSRRFSCVGILDFRDRFEEFMELQKRRMAVLMMMHSQRVGSAFGKLPRAASSGLPRSTSSLPPGVALANIDEEDARSTSRSTDAAAAGSQGSGTSGVTCGPQLHHAATVPPGHVPSASLGSGSLIGNRAVSAAHVPGKAIFDEQSGPITEEKLETRRDLYKSVLSLDEGSLCGQASFPRPSSAQAAHTPTGSQAAYAPFGSLSSPGAEGPRNVEAAEMPAAGLHSLKLSEFQHAPEPTIPKQGVQQIKSVEPCISRSFSWPYCQALADMDFQAPRRDEDGMINTCAWRNGNAAFFLSTDARHPMAFLGSVLFLGKRQQARLAGCVTAPFKPPDKLLGSNLKRAAEVSAKIAKNDADGDLAHTADVSKLAKQVAAEWRDGSTPATTSSDAPISDTVPLFPDVPGTSGRPMPSDSGHVNGRSGGLTAPGTAVSVRDYPQENVYWPPPGFGQSGEPVLKKSERPAQPLSQPPSGAADVPAQPDAGVGTSGPLQGLKNLLVGSRGSSREPASPAQPRGYIQLADVVNNLSGMQTGGQLPQSPVAPGAKLSAITPPDVVSTTNGDGHSENGMLAAFTILGDCFQMIERKPSNMDAILAAAITEIQSVVSQQFNNERHETDIDLGGIDMTASIDMTTEPVQDPEVPDFVGGQRDDRRLGLGGLPPVSSGVSQEATYESQTAEPASHTQALLAPVARVGPGLVDDDAAIDPSKLVYDSLLGRGAFGEVHYGRWEAPDGTVHEVAIKVLLATRYGSLREHEQERSKFFKEMRLMMRMRHHSIVRCFGGAQARQEGERDVMVLEYIPGGTLDHYVHEHRRDNRLSLNEVLVIATDLADVLRYLHRNGIVHQDLKPSNILLNEKGEVKLTDFGISKIKRSTYLSRFMVGTPSYTAPEVWRADAVNEKCDMFALGILLWECMTGTRPFKNMHAFQIMMHLQNTSRQNNADWLPFPSRTPEDFKRLIRRCWHAENRDRISAEEALASAVLLRTRIPDSQLNEPVPLDQQSSRSRDPMMVPRAGSRSVLPGSTAANVSNGKRPGNTVATQQQGEHTGFTVGGSVGNSGPRYMPSSPRHSFDGRGREEAQQPDQPSTGSTGPSGATWSVDLRAPTMKPTGWGLGDSTHSALGMGASNSSLIRKKPEASSSVSGSHSASRSASKSAVSRHAAKPASSSGSVSSHRAIGRVGSRTPQEKLSVVPERDRFTPSGLRMTDVATGSTLRPSGQGRPQLQESMEFTFDERAEMDMTADSQTADGEDMVQSGHQPASPAQTSQPAAATAMRSNEYLPVLPSTQPDIIQESPPPDRPQTGVQAYSPYRSPLGMHPSQCRAANVGTVADGFYGSTRLPWVQTNETTVSVTLAQSDNLEERPPPGQPVLAMHEAWSLASRPKS